MRILLCSFASLIGLCTGCVRASPVAQAPVPEESLPTTASDNATVANIPFVRTDVPSTPFEPAKPSDTVWTIEVGTYAGLQIPLHVEAAFGKPGNREHFWRIAKGGAGPGAIVGWKSTRYPIPIAFRHTRYSGSISPGDSSAFFSIIAQMNADFGTELFRAVTLEADDPPDVIVVDVSDMRSTDGLSRETWTPWGELFDVRVTFRDSETLHDARVVTHEMMHALGFGHTLVWRSVLNPREANFATRVTAEDVAYAELAMSSHLNRERANTRSFVALAVSREQSRDKSDEGYAPCDPVADITFTGEDPMRIRGFLPVGLLTVVSACSSGEKKGSDTIAVPAAAVDTTTDRLPGATPRAEAAPATGVDTPITRKIGAPAPAKK